MAIKDISKEGVSLAIRQFDLVGRDGMLDHYGGGRSIKLYIEKNNQYYDQKLIIRAAHCLELLGSAPSFTAEQAKNRLENLGFRVVPRDFRSELE